MNGHRTINNKISWKAAKRKKLKPAPLRQDGGSEQGWSPAEGGGGGSWTSCSESWWEGAQPLQWPLLKGKKTTLKSHLFAFGSCSLAFASVAVSLRGNISFAEVLAGVVWDARVEGPQACWGGWVPKTRQHSSSSKAFHFDKGKSRYFFCISCWEQCRLPD